MSDVHSLDEEGKSRIAEMLSRLNNAPDAGNLGGAVEELNRIGERLDVLDDSPDSMEFAKEFANKKLSSDKFKLSDGEILPLSSFTSEVVSPVDTKVQAEPPPAELLSKESLVPAEFLSEESPLPALSLTQELHSPQTSSQDMPLPTEPPPEPAPEVVLTSPPTLSGVIPTEPMINEILHPVEPPIQEAVDTLQTTSAEVLPPSAQLPSKELLLPAEPQIQEAFYSPRTLSGVVPPVEPMISDEKLPPVELPSPVVLPSPQPLTEVVSPAESLTKEMVSPAGPVINEMPPLLEKELLSAAELPTKEMSSAAESPTKEMVPPAQPVVNEMDPPVEHLEKRMLSATEHLEKGMFSAAEVSTKKMLSPVEPFMKEMLSLMKELLPLMKEMLPLMRKMFPRAGPLTKETLPAAESPTDETLAATESPVEEMLSSAEPLTKEMSTPTEPLIREMLPIAESPTDEAIAVAESPVKEMLSSAEPLTKEMSTPIEPPMKEMLPILEPPTDETLAAAESPNVETNIIGSPSLPSQQVAIISEHEPTQAGPALQLPQDSTFIGSAKSKHTIPVPSISSVEEMMATFLSSYQDFRSSISKVASLPLSRGKVSSSVDEFSTQEDDDLVLSKTQCELTLEEGRVWDELTLATMPPISPTVTEDDATIPDILTPSDTTPVYTDMSTIAPSPTTMPSGFSPMPTPTLLATAPSFPVETSAIPSLSTTITVKTPTFLPASESHEFGIDRSLFQAAEDRLDALRVRSELITESYQRRTDAPTRSTYMESRRILEAMGILCYEVEGEDEGEALASSLVLQGLADYVVSEDSVSSVFV